MSRKNITYYSQYFTVFLQAVINYRALLRREYSASKKINGALPKPTGSKISPTKQRVCPKQGTIFPLKGFTFFTQL